MNLSEKTHTELSLCVTVQIRRDLGRQVVDLNPAIFVLFLHVGEEKVS